MRTEIFNTQKFRAIQRVLEAHENVFEGKTQVIAAKTIFADKVSSMAEMITDLTVPITSVYYERLKAKEAFIMEFSNILQLSVVFAGSIQDETLRNTVKSYLRRFRSVSTNEVIQYAYYMIGIFTEKLEEAALVGITQETIDQLQARTDGYMQAVENVSLALARRKSRRLQIKQLQSEVRELLANDLDRFVRYHSKTHPDLSFAYNRVRWSRRRRVTNINLPTTSDISGMVKDAVTGLPIVGATLNLIEHAHAITAGADGYYIFDELESGEFTLTCHATGYQVPEPVIINLENNDSYIHNFTLTPVSTED